MGSTTDELKKEWEETQESLKTLRDELRVKMHLAGMDAKDTFSKLEKKADEVSRDVTEVGKGTLQEVVGELRKLKDLLTGK
jgi:hypothetical protein